MSDFIFEKVKDGRAHVGLRQSPTVIHNFLMTPEDVEKNILTYGRQDGLLAAQNALSATLGSGVRTNYSR